MDDNFGFEGIEKIADTDTELVYKLPNTDKVYAAFPEFVTSALGVNSKGELGRPSLVFRGEWRAGKGAPLEPFNLFMEMQDADFVLQIILNNLASILSESSVEMVKSLIVTLANGEVEAGIPSQLEVASKEHEQTIRDAVLNSKEQ